MKKRRKAPASSKAVEPYILKTKLFCGCCEGPMVGDSGTSSNGTVHYYYSCLERKKRRGCKKKSIPKQ
ncbi:recombinase zinc beta ribbon domain-containing protein [Christensenella intestinihominis]|uniref:recombinase zinc beta ribbon domain-containing protein n=1 Tax=Christensenella intestinihominis TaxID=1851429 RepID=UPI002287070F|nr:recombinase zinc beta ribbon domain-containing protein [Christensenella intestinihominis]